MEAAVFGGENQQKGPRDIVSWAVGKFFPLDPFFFVTNKVFVMTTGRVLG
jgi:hypothetical protein